MPRASSPQSDAMTDTWGRRNRVLADRACAHCAKLFRPARATSHYCSRQCSWANNGGQNQKPETWWKSQKGYINGRVWVDGKQRHVKRHRVVAEQMLGRPLRPDEDVHHINGDKADNRPENLQVLTRSDHSKITNANRWSRRAKATEPPHG